jgi:hypothetical protein
MPKVRKAPDDCNDYFLQKNRLFLTDGEMIFVLFFPRSLALSLSIAVVACLMEAI